MSLKILSILNNFLQVSSYLSGLIKNSLFKCKVAILKNIKKAPITNILITIYNNLEFQYINNNKIKEIHDYYNYMYKSVKETITKLTGKTDPNEPPIDRRLIEDPFREDLEIPEKYRHTLDNYSKYMEYGGSMGHNAPAGQHKTNMTIFFHPHKHRNMQLRTKLKN